MTAGFEDAASVEAGADVVSGPVWDSDVVLMINAPQPDEIGKLRGVDADRDAGAAVREERVAALVERGVKPWRRRRAATSRARWPGTSSRPTTA
ncbi:hypothetical protein ACL02T_22705 [Pseudonocardia sp. RS010]|uniref:hypothetical protein n=1 Tax=Pseudonocardia sp. RS010 TaxID=3385979 RepID=UPI00399EEBD8